MAETLAKFGADPIIPFRRALRSTVGSGEGNHCHRGVRTLQSAMPVVHLARQTLWVPWTPRGVRSTELTSEKALAEMWPAARVVRNCAGESMVFGRLIAMPRRSINRTLGLGPPRAPGSCGGGRSTPSLGSSLRIEVERGQATPP